MSVYIPGMEMPKSCFYCPFRLKVDPDTFVCLATNEHIEETFAGTIEMRNRGDCPLIPVPNHGRLIDADAIMKKAGYIEDSWGITEVVVADEIANAPTIIPADGGAE